MKFSDGMAVIEAILFACGDPIELDKLASASEIEKETVVKIIDRLNDRYTELESAFCITRLGDSYQMTSKPDFAPYIKSAMETRRQAPLSQAALEVLAIVAYNQPVTKSFVEQVRGVDSSGVVNSLVERNLLEEYGRLDLPGRPIAYKTTENFLRCFGMNDISGLPPIPDSSGQIDFDEYEEMTFSGGD
ncbi:MAG: SMC-Scp complex subunit ScpB [Oscillospiraceae bacterium]|nr:SMC-Scp complex subunit ScpB [Oscillospiraceae bacterium]